MHRLTLFLSFITLLGLSEAAFLAGGAAEHDHSGCAVQQKNEAILQEGQDFVDRHSAGNSIKYGYPSIAEWWRPHTKTDVPRRDFDYLQDPIISADDMLKATSQADHLEKLGQKKLSDLIRQRVSQASTKAYGRPTVARELRCLSTAERMKDVAFKIEQRGEYSLAEKQYKGIAEIYQTELGASPLLANALGDAARACMEQGRSKDAKDLFARAIVIYDKNPTFVDTDMVSVIESYGNFLQTQKRAEEARKIFARAIAARKRLRQVPAGPVRMD